MMRDMRVRSATLAIAVLGLLALSIGTARAQGHEHLGTVSFPTSCRAAVQADFNRAVALLHSFWFSEAIKGFNAVAQADPACGIAHWGAAVAWLGNPLGGPPTPRGLQEGSAAVARARAAGAGSGASSTTSPPSRPSTRITTRWSIASGPPPTRRRWRAWPSAIRRTARRRSSTRWRSP